MSKTWAPLKREGVLTDDAQEKANILYQQFQSIFSPRLHIEPPTTEDMPHSMPKFDITAEGVLKLLVWLNPHTAAGPDQQKPLVLKELAYEITPAVIAIFSASLWQQTVPDDWRFANVSPVYIKGKKCKAVNYRTISLTCILCKQMEHIIASQVMSHLK